MTLIKCPECGSKVSNKAKACRNCGYPVNLIKESKNSQGKSEEIKKVDEPHIDENLIISDTLEYCQKNRINGNDTGAVKQYIVDKYNIDDERVSIICKKVQDADFKRSLKIVGGVFGVVLIVFILYLSFSRIIS